MPAQMNLVPTRNDQMEAEGLIWGTFTWGGDSAIGLTGPLRDSSFWAGLFHSTNDWFHLTPSSRLAQSVTFAPNFFSCL